MASERLSRTKPLTYGGTYTTVTGQDLMATDRQERIADDGLAHRQLMHL
jgi:hypothetical protein